VIESGDSYVLGIGFSSILWATVSSCRIVGGLKNTLGQAVGCSVLSDSYFYASNFNSFETNPLLSSATNYRLRLEFVVSTLSNTTCTAYIEMFANMDAYTNNYERIFQKSAVAYDPFFFNGPTGTNVESLNSILGNFILQKLTNTYIYIYADHSCGRSLKGSSLLLTRSLSIS
jgi:hypothetical protein